MRVHLTEMWGAWANFEQIQGDDKNQIDTAKLTAKVCLEILRMSELLDRELTAITHCMDFNTAKGYLA